MKNYERLHENLSDMLDEFGIGDTLTVLGVQIGEKAPIEDLDKFQKDCQLSSELHRLSMKYQYPSRRN